MTRACVENEVNGDNHEEECSTLEVLEGLDTKLVHKSLIYSLNKLYKFVSYG